jgi:transposase
MMPVELLPLCLPGFGIDEIKQHDCMIEVVAHSIGDEAICPDCQQVSQRIHSYYERLPADLPILEYTVCLRLTVRRFRCQNPRCSKTTFVERWPQLIRMHAQRTERLSTVLGIVAYALGGQAGSQLATQLKMPTSADTLLRIIRHTPEREMPEPKIIGVDDWARRRGRVYGTLVVDLERHCVIDLLPDRTAETLASWLKVHEQVKIVARDRSAEYARGITLGAPQAQQVADRWHLLVNLRDAFIRVLDRLRSELKVSSPAQNGQIPLLRSRRSSQKEVAARDTRRARRLELHEKVHRLRRAGHAIQAIARQLKLSRMTVYRYLSMRHYPEQAVRKRSPSILEPFLPHLNQRWQAGARNASELWREICTQGYSGSPRQVARWVYERREQPAPSTPTKYLKPESSSGHLLFSLNESADQPALPASRRLVWLFLKHTDQLAPEDLTLRDQLLTHPALFKTRQLAQDFQRIVRERQAPSFEVWLRTCETAGIPEFANFATGLRQDDQAVKAALTFAWSNGQTEGQVNKLKLLKRQMYGRANLDLLRLRALYKP